MIYLVAIIFAFYFFQRMKSVRGLHDIDAQTLCRLLQDMTDGVKILDLRDQTDYYANHIEGAINISLGRLPYVKKKELHIDDKIILIADSKYHSKKAARILKKSGFNHLTNLQDGMRAYQQIQPKVLKNCCA
ncbi:rhodanese-like domain-containing protein [Paenibacillus agricola]|uniref:Rhodanese-like domain-containing protein n=1 Tax=Paenibacillus agricola TaxID=2716264 RepID=A0ABX0JKN9_9BACL|nr:rhodanese-like domain-containing protein [Paenibacillus agricola]NHN34485.1 rhodanese-like domain-containing protein [Paenibacillus agricola]